MWKGVSEPIQAGSVSALLLISDVSRATEERAPRRPMGTSQSASLFGVRISRNGHGKLLAYVTS